MEILIRVDEAVGGGFVARDAHGLTAKGSTSATAASNLRAELARQLAAGTLQFVQVPASPTPAEAMAGIFKDDPLFDEWVAAIAENRRLQDAEDAARLAAEAAAERPER